MPRKRQTATPGTLFGIPRLDGQMVIGQVLEEWYVGVVCIAVFDYAIPTPESLDPSSLSAAAVISVTSVASAEITKSYWKVVGAGALLVNPRLSPHRKFSAPDFIGAQWHSGGTIEKLVNAYYGLATWEPYPGRPGQLKSLLLSAGTVKH